MRISPTEPLLPIWLKLLTPIAGVVVSTTEQEPGAVLTALIGALFYAVYSIDGADYRWWHFPKAFFGGVVSAVVFGALAASGIAGLYDQITGVALAALTCFAGAIGPLGLEWLSSRAESVIRPPRSTPDD